MAFGKVLRLKFGADVVRLVETPRKELRDERGFGGNHPCPPEKFPRDPTRERGLSCH